MKHTRAEACLSSALLLFVHDDVWIDDCFIAIGLSKHLSDLRLLGSLGTDASPNHMWVGTF